MHHLRRALVVAATVFGLIGAWSPAAHAESNSTLSATSYLMDAPPGQSPEETFQLLKEGKSSESLGLIKGPRSVIRGNVRRTGPKGLGGEFVRANTGVGGDLPGRLPRVTDPVKRTITLEECKSHTATDASMWIPSRSAMCESRWFATEWLQNGKVVGFSQMTATAIATISAREVRFDYHFSDFYAAGVNEFDAVLIGPSEDYETVPNGLELNGGGLNPGPETVAQIKKNPHIMISVFAEPGKGMAPDDVVWAVWNMTFEREYPAPWKDLEPLNKWKFSSFGARWDNSAYLPNYKPADVLNTGGAIFSYDVSPLRYSTAAASEERGVALHVQKAFTAPATTLPQNPAKNVAGQSVSDPLHRLQKSLGQTNLNRYNANRREAVKICTSVDPKYASKGLECDEYPFASTYEGSAQSIYETSKPKNNFSALAIPAAENGKGGSQLATYYNDNRIIDGPNDEFYVVIIP
ncbi:NucA/NucB deoxyribonuclease domain-containing protein [Streptomyces sp. NPDC014685]|uniref:NucA/NucB deoxyribonuclease domain-containing protein n=1 Tax=Streptomyces sp. NPDC014685 TaxID=3364881 RepID=UPI0036FF4703